MFYLVSAVSPSDELSCVDHGVVRGNSNQPTFLKVYLVSKVIENTCVRACSKGGLIWVKFVHSQRAHAQWFNLHTRHAHGAVRYRYLMIVSVTMPFQYRRSNCVWLACHVKMACHGKIKYKVQGDWKYIHKKYSNSVFLNKKKNSVVTSWKITKTCSILFVCLLKNFAAHLEFRLYRISQ